VRQSRSVTPVPYSTLFRSYLVRLATGVDRHAAVALLGGGVAIEAVVAVGAEAGVGQLVLLRLGLLQADHVGVLLAQPGEETLARSEEHTSELQSRENLVCR